VLVTAHQAFFTEEAMSQIAQITLQNIRDLINGVEPRDRSAILV
jgi:D-lactate dehydrogenase